MEIEQVGVLMVLILVLVVTLVALSTLFRLSSWLEKYPKRHEERMTATIATNRLLTRIVEQNETLRDEGLRVRIPKQKLPSQQQ